VNKTVRSEEVCIIEEVGFADEKIGSGFFAFTFRSLMYMFLGGVLGYRLIMHHSLAGIVLGVAVVAMSFWLSSYPGRSVRLEATLILALMFYLTELARMSGWALRSYRHVPDTSEVT
jgi:hypothetical protein